MSSTLGTLFRVTSFGESHGVGLGCVVDGCPAGIEISPALIQAQMDRRRPGQSHLSTPRREGDQVEILSGLDENLTLGSPIALLVRNRDQRPGDYREFSRAPRPSHADYSYRMKYGPQKVSGGGRASARETLARVAAGSIAEQFLARRFGVEIVAWVSQIGEINSAEIDQAALSRSQVDASLVRCPDPAVSAAMISLIEEVKAEGDSIGGVIRCVCRQVPAGWGEPVFDKLDALLARAMLSLPAAKGFASGSGFASTRLRGSQHNDRFVASADGLATLSNHSGGILGGVSNGSPIIFEVAFKPVPTIGKAQKTAAYDGSEIVLEGRGRHDPCVLPRAVPIVEGMAAMVLADLALRQQAMVSVRQEGAVAV